MKHGETVGGYRIVRRRRQARGEGTRVSLDDPSAGVEASVDSDAAVVCQLLRGWGAARHPALSPLRGLLRKGDTESAPC